MNALITGANGFIGSNLAKHLIDKGLNVKGLVRKTSDLKFLEGFDIELVYGDITDKNSVVSAMTGVDMVFHVAGLAFDWGAYQKYYDVNFTGTKNVVEAAFERGVKRFIHISTVAFHGFGYTGISEDYPIEKDLIPYAHTKYLAEKWLFEFGKKNNFAVSAIRPGNVFGPNDHTFIKKYLDALKSGKIAYVNKGKSKTCPTYIENLVDAIYKASLEQKAIDEAFFITDGLDINWRTFTEKLAKEMNIKAPSLSIPLPAAKTVAVIMESIYKFLHIKTDPFLTTYRVSNGGLDYHFSIEKARQLLDYKPIVELDESIKRTIEWYLGQ